MKVDRIANRSVLRAFHRKKVEPSAVSLTNTSGEYISMNTNMSYNTCRLALGHVTLEPSQMLVGCWFLLRAMGVYLA